MQPRKRYRRASASFRRLFTRPSGRGCLRLSLRSFEPSALCPPVRPAASGQQVRRGRVQQGWFRLCPFCPRSSARALLSVSLCLFKSRQPESRKVESRQRVVSQSRQSRESRQVKSRKSRKGRDIRVPTCAKVVKS